MTDPSNRFEATNAEARKAPGPEPVPARLDKHDPQRIRCGASGGTCPGELGRVRYSSGPPAQLQRFIELPPGWAKAKRPDGPYALTPRAQARYQQAQMALGRGELSGGTAAVPGGPRTRRPVPGSSRSMPVSLRPPANSTAICPHCRIRNRYEPKTLGL